MYCFAVLSVSIVSQDYLANTSNTLEFETGSEAGFTFCLNITIIDNSPVEDPIEAFQIELISSDSVVNLANPSVGFVRITDDDCKYSHTYVYTLWHN